MSPKTATRSSSGKAPSASASASSAPYPSASSSSSRRSSSQPKSTRQQFSACGACRMRRVRCDLKDLQAANPAANHSACSNCLERGLKCVDEFAEVKAVKLLRRGRRLAQVEAVYGKAAVQAQQTAGTSASANSSIPRLRTEFFNSSFYRSFILQRPLLDTLELPSRFAAALKGSDNILGVGGNILCLALSTWAASYGVDERGELEPADQSRSPRRRRETTNEMVRELLHLVDVHGVLRKPSWDGVRTLLLIIPLSEDVQTAMDRLSMYEASLNQVYTLCSLANTSTINSGQGEYVDAAVRARIFWYAHVHESLTTALRGGRLMFAEEDLASFEATLPYPPSPTAQTPSPSLQHHSQSPQLSTSQQHYTTSFRLARTPVSLSRTARRVHRALTGPRAKGAEQVDEGELKRCWDELAHAWESLEDVRQGFVGVLTHDELDRFVNGWQILIFECYNVIREALKQRVVSSPHTTTDGRQSVRHAQATRLHSLADSKCRDVARLVVSIVRQHLSVGSSMFEFDASLVRDGIFFAGVLLAGEVPDHVAAGGSPSEVSQEDEVSICLKALREMKWAFAKSEEREQAIRTVWEARLENRRASSSASQQRQHHQQMQQTAAYVTNVSMSPYAQQPQMQSYNHPYPSLSMVTQQRHSGSSSGSATPPLVQARMRHQQHVPTQLSIHPGMTVHNSQSAPNTAAAEDASWAAALAAQVQAHTHSPPSLSASPPFVTTRAQAAAASAAAQSSMASLLGVPPNAGTTGSSSDQMPVYYSLSGDTDAFAFSVPSQTHSHTSHVHANHNITPPPPRSSAGIQSSSQGGFFGGAAGSNHSGVYTQSPPGTASTSGGAAADVEDSVSAYQAATYGGGFFGVSH